MTGIANLLAQHELLLLLIVVVLGLCAGRLQIASIRLGIAGVLFVGIGISAWITTYGLKPITITELKDFGLVLFVYSVGLSSGPGFFSAFRDRGIRLNLILAVTLISASMVAVLGGHILGLRRGLIAGLFCGSLTNTPALGAATEALRYTTEAIDPVLAYSITYPFGVLGALLSFRIFFSAQESHFKRESEESLSQSDNQIASISCTVTNDEVLGQTIGELDISNKLGVIFSRLQRGQNQTVPTEQTKFQHGDLVNIVGSKKAVESAIVYLGERTALNLEADRSQIDMRRILLSKRSLAGKSIKALKLEEKFNAQVTRVRRADIELVPSPNLRVEVGDRLRVIAPKDRLSEVSIHFGDSERELAEVDYIALTLGISAGLILGLIPIPLFGTDLRLGAAGGPLIIGLLLGRLGRKGKLNWTLPYEVNVTLRELGLLLFLAGVGISAGSALDRLGKHDVLHMLTLGAIVTLVSVSISLFCARRFARATVITSAGATSGMGTQPATLAVAYELSGKSNETYVAYALVFPVAMVGKIFIAQILTIIA